MNSERQLHISSRCVFGVWWPLWKPRLASKQRRSNLTSTSNDQVETRIPDLRCAAKLSTVLVPSLKGDSTPLYSPLSLPLSLSLSLFALLCLGLGAGAVLPLSLPLSLSLSLSLSPCNDQLRPGSQPRDDDQLPRMVENRAMACFSCYDSCHEAS